VIGSPIRCGMGQSESLDHAALLRRNFQSLHFHRVVLGSASDSSCCFSHAISKKVAQPFACCDHLDELDDSCAVAPRQIEPVSIQKTILVALHGKGDYSARRNRVKAQFVAQHVRIDDSFGIIAEALRAERVDRFILRTSRPALVLPFLDYGDATASDWASSNASASILSMKGTWPS